MFRQRRPGARLLLGLHLVRVPFGVHVTYDRYFGSEPPGIKGSIDWVNLWFEYRFQGRPGYCS